MERITLKGRPVSTNHAYKVTCRGKFATVYMTPVAKSTKGDYILQARSQYKKKPIQDELSLTIKHYHPDKRKRDVDNYHKLVLDALSGILYEDDVQIVELITQKFIDKEDPRIEVIIN